MSIGNEESRHSGETFGLPGFLFSGRRAALQELSYRKRIQGLAASGSDLGQTGSMARLSGSRAIAS
jgi:hypothetical protein